MAQRGKRRKPWSDQALARLCFKNSLRLQDAAQLLSGKKHFGPGYHLLAAAIEEQSKGIVYSLWAGKLALKGSHNVGNPLTFKTGFVRASPTSHQDRFVLFADLLFLNELIYDVKNRLGVSWKTSSGAQAAVKTIVRAVTGRNPQLAAKLDSSRSLAWAAKAHYSGVPIYRELRDSGVYIDFDGKHLTGPSDIDSTEFGVLREGLDWVRHLWAPMMEPNAQHSPYSVLMVGLLSFVRSKKRFNIPKPWKSDLATRWGYTDSYWIDVAIGLLKESPLRGSSLRADSSRAGT